MCRAGNTANKVRNLTVCAEVAIDAIVLAGDKSGSKNFAGRNKNFLKVGGKPLLAHVLEALDEVIRIPRVIIAGPAAAIDKLIRDREPEFGQSTQFIVIEQRDTMYGNIWSAFLHLLGDDYAPGLEATDSNLEEKPVLVVPGDTPLMCAEEINEFLDGCMRLPVDYGVGMTEERYLNRFKPRDGKPGIEMSYLHLSSGNFRLNNLHFARPFKVRRRAYLDRIYGFRYQSRFRNILKVLMDFMRTKGLGMRPVFLYLVAQLAVVFHSLGLGWLLALTRRILTPGKVLRVAGILMGARVAIVETTGGGCAVDVDNEFDYQTMCQRYKEYRQRPPFLER